MAQQNMAPNGNKTLCKYGMRCSKLNDPGHWSQFDHQPEPCKWGASCRDIGDPMHARLFSHPGHSLALAVRPVDGPSKFYNEEEDEKQEPPVRPIPFMVKLLALGAIMIPVLDVVGFCDTDMHWLLLKAGIMLCVPLIVFHLAYKSRHAWMLNKFIAGTYEPRAECRVLSWWWFPVRLQLLDREAFLEVFYNDRPSNEGSHSGGMVSENSDGTFELEIPDCHAVAVTVTLEGSKLRGLPGARFNGAAITSMQGGQLYAWKKRGYWRFDYVWMLLASLAFIGVLSVFVAAALPPRLSNLGSLRMPLKASFLFDGSDSINHPQWVSELNAVKSMISSFEQSYSQDEGKINVGLVQFSTDARVEASMTDDLASVKEMLERPLTQMGGLTYFNKALQSCKDSFGQQFESRSQSFDICVLITDGFDMSKMSTEELDGLVPGDSAIFGIFVGDTTKSFRGKDTLQSITKCGLAERYKKDRECGFFASASNFDELKRRAHEVASGISEEATVASCLVRWDNILPMLMWYPFLAAPCILWWLYGAIRTVKHRMYNNNTNFVHGNYDKDEKASRALLDDTSQGEGSFAALVDATYGNSW